MNSGIGSALGDEDIVQLQKRTRSREQAEKKRAITSVAALLFSVGANVPFSSGRPLHSWNKVGTLILFSTMLLFLVAVYRSAIWWGALGVRRQVERTFS